MCASSYLRFLSQISTSSLSSSGLHILRPHLVFTRSDLHRRVTLSLSYHLQDFIMQLLSQLYNLIYLRLQNFISPRSRANRRLVGSFFVTFRCSAQNTSWQQEKKVLEAGKKSGNSKSAFFPTRENVSQRQRSHCRSGKKGRKQKNTTSKRNKFPNRSYRFEAGKIRRTKTP